MSTDWIRACSLTVGGLDITPNWEDASAGLRIRFQVKQSTIETTNALYARIYNVSGATAQLPKEGDPVVLQAGYRDNIGILFQGEVVQALKGKENPVDSYLDLVCGDGDRAHNFGVLNKSFPAKTTGRQVFDAVAEEFGKFGVTVGHVTEDLAKLVYPRAQAFFMMGRDVLHTLAHTIDATWSIQNGELQMVGKKETVGGGIVLNAQTGLIGIPIETIEGIIIRSLINPALKVNDQVVVDASSINRAEVVPGISQDLDINQLSLLGTNDGAYKILAIDITGDTRGQEWYQDLTCIGAITNVAPNSQVQRGRGGDGPYIGPQ
jgi:hypothetical protein